MRTSHRHFFALISACLTLAVASGVATLPLWAAGNAETVTVRERGLHHRIVENEGGGTYTVLADGLCYDDNGVLKDSEEIFELEPGFAVARRGQHKATLAANINSERVVELTAPDGKRFVSRIAGLSYFSAATAENILIAQVQDSIGVLHPPNQIIYPAALVGDGVTADVRYTWRKGGFAQDVLIRSIRPPEAYFLDPASARLQAWTLFLEAPEPQIEARALRTEEDQAKRQALAEPDFNDQTLRFGVFQISDGRAFELGQEGNSSIPVGKEWGKSETGDTYLIESLEYLSAKAALDALPVNEARANPPKNANLAGRKLSRQQLMAALAKPSIREANQKQTMQVAMKPDRRPGYTIDYDLWHTSSHTDFTFQSDRTFMLDGILSLSGTTTLESAVIKFSPYNSYYPAYIKITGSGAKINCNTAPYRPCFLTASTDSTVGEMVTTGTPSGYYATYGIYFDSSADANSYLHDIRIRYANTGIYYASGSGHKLRHAQVVNCFKGFDGGYGAIVRLQNALISSYTAVNGYLQAKGENLTISGYAPSSGPTVYLTNSLLSVASAQYYLGVNNYVVPSGTFQSLGAGHFYLASDIYRGVGTIAIDPTLLADLRKRTTYPPTVLSSDFTSFTVLMPTPIADVDDPGIINDIDGGYHYDVLHYAWSGRNLTSTLLLTNGVAVAHYGTRGTIFQQTTPAWTVSPKFISEGSPLQRNVLAPYYAVQESTNEWGTAGSTFSIFATVGAQQATPEPEIYLRFTDISFPPSLTPKRYLLEHANGNLPKSLTLRDCDISTAYLILSNSTASSTVLGLGLTNNLFRRANFTLRRDTATSLAAALFNNTFINSTLSLAHNSGTGIWEVRDNLFDAVSLTAGSVTFPHSHNGYISTTQLLLPDPSGFDKTVTVRDYLTGPLGTNYYPTTGAGLNNLRNAGSRLASQAALFHHTVRTDQGKAGVPPPDPATVSIGHHYVALSSQNLAVNRYASQSSTAANGEAYRAINGNTDGNFANGSVTMTLSESQPWWQLDLGQIESLQTITLWNRTDCCADRLSNFYLIVSDDPFTSTSLSTTLAQAGISSYYTSGQAGISTTFVVNRTARYVRVQLTGANILSLAEVQVNTAQFPPDQERDGIADYLEDANGDGLVSSGESDHKGPIVTINTPVDGFTINTTRINVQGSVSHTSPLKEVAVNGVRAFLTGTTFEGRNVGLTSGANLVLATAVDLAGNAGFAWINISGVPIGPSLVDPVILTATPSSGFASLLATFQVTSAAPGTFQDLRYDFQGNNSYGAPHTTPPPFPPVQNNYAAGEYFPVATIRTTSGSFSSDGGWNAHGNVLAITVRPQPQSSTIAVTDPVDVKSTAGGYVYVLSRAPAASITQYDGGGNVVRSISGIGTTPTGLDVNSAGKVYVALTGGNQVRKFLPTTDSFELDTTFNGTGFIGKADGTSGSAPGEFNAPYDVAVAADGLSIYVSDTGNNRLQKFTANGSFVLSIGTMGSAFGQFNSPKGLSVSKDGALFACDSGNNRIVQLVGDGVYRMFGVSGSAPGQYQSPLNVACDVKRLYVADSGNNRIQKLDRETLNPIMQLSSGLNQPASISIADDPLAERICIANTSGDGVIISTLPIVDPITVWDNAKQSLINGEIESALTYFSQTTADSYRTLFAKIGTTKLSQDMTGIGALTPISIDEDEAQYYFTRMLDTQTFIFVVIFVTENGLWRIRRF